MRASKGRSLQATGDDACRQYVIIMREIFVERSPFLDSSLAVEVNDSGRFFAGRVHTRIMGFMLSGDSTVRLRLRPFGC
jgi:hypothetical protein